MSARPASRDWIVRRAPADRFERIEAYFGGRGYGLHRHDTYAIGCTLAGVQSFHYRRGLRHSLPGGVLVLHPDEAHDGQAGTDAGFHYRMAYVQPALIQRILGGRPLPFIRDGISSDPRLGAACAALLRNDEDDADPLREDDALYDLTLALCAAAGQAPAPPACPTTPPANAPASTSTTPTAWRCRWTTWNAPPASTAGACRAISAHCMAPAPTAMRCCAGSTWRGA